LIKELLKEKSELEKELAGMMFNNQPHNLGKYGTERKFSLENMNQIQEVPQIDCGH
jgi:hypothetical protein